jgi:hypothetical protein
MSGSAAIPKIIATFPPRAEANRQNLLRHQAAFDFFPIAFVSFTVALS